MPVLRETFALQPFDDKYDQVIEEALKESEESSLNLDLPELHDADILANESGLHIRA